jgi:hypothetical protein
MENKYKQRYRNLSFGADNELYPQKEQDDQQDDKPCENYIDNERGFACSLYCHFHQECDGITCKKDCEYYKTKYDILNKEKYE